MRLRFFVGFFSLLFIPLFSLHAYNLTEVLEKIEGKESQIESISFAFQQNIKFLDMDMTSEIQGVATFEKPDNIRIDKKKPNRQLTVSNGKNMWVYTPSFNQVWVGKSKDWFEASKLSKGVLPINDYVTGLKKNFELSLSPDENQPSDDPTVLIRADSKTEKIPFHLELLISTITWLPVQTTFLSESAKVVTHLSDLEINPSIEDGAFSFSPPEGTDVIPLN